MSNRVEDEQFRHCSDMCISSFSIHFSVDSLSAKHDMHLIRALSRSISSNSKDGEASCTDLPPHRNRLWHGWQARGEISTILKDLITDPVGSLRVETPTESVVWWTGNDCNPKYQHTLSLIDAMDRCFLVSKSILKSDHFPGCARKTSLEQSIVGAPNFLQNRDQTVPNLWCWCSNHRWSSKCVGFCWSTSPTRSQASCGLVESL